MRLTFEISQAFPIAADVAKEYAHFCVQEAAVVCKRRGLHTPKRVHFRMIKAASWERSGRAQVNRGTRFAFPSRRVFLRISKTTQTYVEVYPKFKDMPRILISGTLERYVHLLAHELGHAVCGFTGGRLGEVQCERFAERTLDAWRLQYRDPACSI